MFYIKTIAEVAKLCGVTPQAVYKKINGPMGKELQPYIKKKNGKQYIETPGIQVLQAVFQPEFKPVFKPFTTVENSLNPLKVETEKSPENGESIGLNQLKTSLNAFKPLKAESEESLENGEISSLNELKTVYNQLKEVMEQEIVFLKSEIEVKNRQIESLLEQSKNNQILLRAEQQNQEILPKEEKEAPVVKKESFWRWFWGKK